MLSVEQSVPSLSNALVLLELPADNCNKDYEPTSSQPIANPPAHSVDSAYEELMLEISQLGS
jgi:hypothetical protein